MLAAGAPVLLVPLILKQLPESMAFLVKKSRTEEIRRIVSRLSPDYRAVPGDVYMLPEKSKAAASANFGSLFSQGRGFSTVMFWVTCFMCLFMVYALSSWLTKLMASAGYSLGSALSFVLVLDFGAMIGAGLGGWLADRLHIKYVLVGMELALERNFLAIAIPAAIASFSILLINHRPSDLVHSKMVHAAS